MSAGPRHGPLSPVSIDSNPEPWSPANSRFQNPPFGAPGLGTPNSSTGEFQPYPSGYPPSKNPLATPPASVHSSVTTTSNGGIHPPNMRSSGQSGNMSNGEGGMRRRGTGMDNPSPPSSVARSSQGSALLSARMSETGSINPRNMALLEETLAEHYTVLKNWLGNSLPMGAARPNRARDKLLRLSTVQFQELSEDVYDELLRREDERRASRAEGSRTPKYLLPKQSFHPKRNQARQKLSTLPIEKFRQLVTDVYYELERRFPRFGGGDIDRVGSPAMSMRGGRGGGPMRGGPGFRGRGGPPPPGFRGPPPMGRGRPDSNQSMSPNGEYGRPMPKQFQQNTIVPNKSTMVEDDDDQFGSDDDTDDAFGLEGAANRQSKRNTGRAMSKHGEKVISDLQNKIAELEEKADGLQMKLEDKEAELERTKSSHSDDAAEQAELRELREELEQKLADAQALNANLETELARLRDENADMASDMKSQIEAARANSSNDGEWQRRYQDLEDELSQQQQVTEDVRAQAGAFLQEMRDLSDQTSEAVEKEEKLSRRVTQLESEVQDWKTRYTRTKTQLRTIKSQSIGLPPDAIGSAIAAREAFSSPQGVIKDIHLTRFQVTIDELLSTARSDPSALTDQIKVVVTTVRKMTADVDASGLTKRNGPEAKLKARVSATANNLITAARNHATSAGLSPVSLLDAAASHLTTSVVELVRAVKLCPTSEQDMEAVEREAIQADTRTLDARIDKLEPAPLRTPAPAPAPPAETLQSKTYTKAPSPYDGGGYGGGYDGADYDGAAYGDDEIAPPPPPMKDGMNGYAQTNGFHSRMESKGSVESYGYSISSNSAPGGPDRDDGLADFKAYLDDQTATLVHNIQPLVHTIRSMPSGSSISPADADRLDNHIAAISGTIAEISQQTDIALQNAGSSNKALNMHAIPVVDVLEQCRAKLEQSLEGGRWSEMPPAAFRVARATKELVLRVERIEAGELTTSDRVEVNV